jgi:hypothetical protein
VKYHDNFIEEDRCRRGEPVDLSSLAKRGGGREKINFFSF